MNAFFDDREYNLTMGAGSLGVTIDDFNNDNFDHTDLDFIHGGSISLKQQGKTPIAQNLIPDGTKDWGADFKNESIMYFNSSVNVRAQMVTLPHRENYLSLDPTYKDEYGRPLLRITYDINEHDRTAHEFMVDRIEEVMLEMGASHVSRTELPEHFNSHPAYNDHIVGGVIVGADSSNSVVNNYCQMWEEENVFVIGESLFPHNGGYNPTFTVGAFAYRAAESIDSYLDDNRMLVEDATTASAN